MKKRREERKSVTKGKDKQTKNKEDNRLFSRYCIEQF